MSRYLRVGRVQHLARHFQSLLEKIFASGKLTLPPGDLPLQREILRDHALSLMPWA